MAEELELKGAVQQAMREILAEQKPMPMPAPHPPATEIIIRTGPPESIRVLGGGGYPLCACPRMSEVPLDEMSRKRLQRIQEKTGHSGEELLRELERRMKARAIEEWAQELGVEQPEPSKPSP